MDRPDTCMFVAKIVADNSPRKADVSQILLLFCRQESERGAFQQGLALDPTLQPGGCLAGGTERAQKKSGAPKRAALS